MGLLIILAFLQCGLMVAAQTLLKLSVQLFGPFSWSLHYFRIVFTTWQFALSGLCAVASVVVMMIMLKRYELSLAFPLVCITNLLITFFSANFVLHETLPLTRWIGLVIVIIGALFIIK